MGIFQCHVSFHGCKFYNEFFAAMSMTWVGSARYTDGGANSQEVLPQLRVDWGDVGKKSTDIHNSWQIITTSAEVTLNGGLVRESLPNPLNSGLGIVLICPDN